MIRRNEIQARGRGGGMGRGGRGRNGGFAGGPGGACVCPRCGKKMPHEIGTPCTGMTCPDCGVPLVREG